MSFNPPQGQSAGHIYEFSYPTIEGCAAVEDAQVTFPQGDISQAIGYIKFVHQFDQNGQVAYTYPCMKVYIHEFWSPELQDTGVPNNTLPNSFVETYFNNAYKSWNIWAPLLDLSENSNWPTPYATPEPEYGWSSSITEASELYLGTNGGAPRWGGIGASLLYFDFDNAGDNWQVSLDWLNWQQWYLDVGIYLRFGSISNLGTTTGCGDTFKVYPVTSDNWEAVDWIKNAYGTYHQGNDPIQWRGADYGFTYPGRWRQIDEYEPWEWGDINYREEVEVIFYIAREVIRSDGTFTPEDF